MTSIEDIKQKVRKTPLSERLIYCKRIVAKLCSESRPPNMSVPVRARDEDVILCTTIEDAIEAIEALKRIKTALDDSRINMSDES